jgi:hypothetical protein
MALVSTSRHFPPKQSGGKETWVAKYAQYAQKIPVSKDLKNVETKFALNNFELAKLADLATVDKFVGYFHKNVTLSSKLDPIRADITAAIKKAIQQVAKRPDGEAEIDTGDVDTKHFFVTLHLLRSAHAYSLDIDRTEISAIVSAAKQYCIKQCYYVSGPMLWHLSRRASKLTAELPWV